MDRDILALGLVVLLLATPLAASEGGGLVATEIQGQGPLTASASNATVLYQSEELTGHVTASTSDRITVKLVNDSYETHANPTDVETQVAGDYNRYVEEFVFDRGHLVLEELTEPNATLLSRPSPATETTLTLEDTYSLAPTDREVLEESHIVNESSTETRFYYDYTATEALRMSPEDEGEVVTRGTLFLYVWGAQFTVDGPENVERFETGHRVVEDSRDVGAFVREEFVFAEVRIHDARLELDARNADEFAVFGETLLADPDENSRTQFRNATGVLPSDEGARQAEAEPLTAADGAFTWTYADASTLQASAEQPAANVYGGQPAASLGERIASGAQTGGLVLAGLLALAAFVATPNLYHRWRSWRGRGVTDTPPAGREVPWWKANRARGWHAMALEAEERYWYRLAAFFEKGAHRVLPDVPSHARNVATNLGRAGVYEEAIEYHRRAHYAYDIGPGPEGAFNAYEAARAASLAGDADAAVGWLKVAAEWEGPRFVRNAATSPDFREMRKHADWEKLRIAYGTVAHGDDELVSR